jgi:NADH:ubiquinone oxidoreductase subunit 6 (subunit J)
MAVSFVDLAVCSPYNEGKGEKMNIQTNQSNLRHILHANAMFSATSGLFFLLAARPLAEFLETTAPVMYILAVVMFGYAALIAFNTYRPEISRGFTLFTVIGDTAWVLASILLLLLPGFSIEAKWAIGITAICVDIFATLQFLEWRKMR